MIERDVVAEAVWLVDHGKIIDALVRVRDAAIQLENLGNLARYAHGGVETFVKALERAVEADDE